MDSRNGVQKSRKFGIVNDSQQPKLGAQIYIADSGRVFVYQTVKVQKNKQIIYVKSGKFEVLSELTPQLLWESVMECLKYGQDWQAIQEANKSND